LAQHEFKSGCPSRFIQIFNCYLEPGGEEKSVARIANHLAFAGHEVVRFWRSSAEWTGPNAPPRFRQALLLWHNSDVLRDLARLHRQIKPHAWVLHNVLPVVSLGVYKLAKELEVPIIQWLHNYRPISPSGSLFAGHRSLRPDDPFLTLKEICAGSWRGPAPTAWLSLCYAILKWRGDYSTVRAWIAISEETRSAFELAGWPASRLHVLRHSWDIEDSSLTAEDFGYFLFLGRMTEEKGVRFLVELWLDAGLRHIPLVMAGQGPSMSALRKISGPKVQWMGHVTGERKRQLLRRCRAVLFPALWREPLGLVAYEAYESGKPIIASCSGGLLEIVKDHETGLLVEPGNQDAWKAAILLLAQDAVLAHQLGTNGLRWLKQNASPERWSKQFDAILSKVIEH
jgi:glycosyltransferase involved in cell wall biosynthesis